MNWMKDSSGKSSATLTMMFLSFIVLALCIIIPMFNGTYIGTYLVSFEKPDNALVIAMLGAFVPAYVIRKNAVDKNNNGIPDEEEGEQK